MTRLLRVAEVLDRIGIGRAQLYRKLDAGEFPEPVRVGKKSVRFLEDDIEQWIASRPRRNAVVDLEREYGR